MIILLVVQIQFHFSIAVSLQALFRYDAANMVMRIRQLIPYQTLESSPVLLL